MSQLESVDLSDALVKTATEVFSTMMNLDLATCHDRPRFEDSVGAVLHYSEPKDVALLFTCEHRLAVNVAEVFLSPEEPHSLSEDDIRDGVCEMSNMLSGMLRSHLDLGVTLDAIPSLLSSDVRDQLAGKQVVADVVMASEHGLMQVSLFRQ